ncbi:hypothetical protein ALC56_12112 [Trachymyrmex septentrionalis]|uniref:Uncharacterized protein n=1 Tax=Trachymyrmex septentrionalis TaxID=34720 RepID=A0A195EYN0_9HYME|nr:hypothetical protein ALC56_12112 [Trachymyrmex septentrionalis]
MFNIFTTRRNSCTSCCMKESSVSHPKLLACRKIVTHGTPFVRLVQHSYSNRRSLLAFYILPFATTENKNKLIKEPTNADQYIINKYMKMCALTLLCVHLFDLVNLNGCEAELFEVLLIVYVVHREADVDGRFEGAAYPGDGLRRRGYVVRVDQRLWLLLLLLLIVLRC